VFTRGANFEKSKDPVYALVGVGIRTGPPESLAEQSLQTYVTFEKIARKATCVPRVEKQNFSANKKRKK
jgi:hypothetical protein